MMRSDYVAAQGGVKVFENKSPLGANDICGYLSASPLISDFLSHQAHWKGDVGIGCQSIQNPLLDFLSRRLFTKQNILGIL